LVSNGASYCVYLADEVVSGRITPTCTLLLVVPPVLDGLALFEEPPQALSASRPPSARSAPLVVRSRALTVVLSMGSRRRGHELFT
jgi:hypothetical protein